ncbi:hypothetical protein BH11PSE11_BH11PSE11_28370 [soil metagenome]
MKNARLLLAAILMSTSFLASAQAPAASANAPAANPPAMSAPKAAKAAKPDSAEKFAAKKERALERIAKRLQSLQTEQSCVQAANDRAAMKACRKAAHPGHHGRKHHKAKKQNEQAK